MQQTSLLVYLPYSFHTATLVEFYAGLNVPIIVPSRAAIAESLHTGVLSRDPKVGVWRLPLH